MQTALSYALGSPARTTIKYYGPPYGLHSLSLCSYGFIAPIHACVLFSRKQRPIAHVGNSGFVPRVFSPLRGVTPLIITRPQPLIKAEPREGDSHVITRGVLPGVPVRGECNRGVNMKCERMRASTVRSALSVLAHTPTPNQASR